jgi:ABC-type sugar transport system ATPase subunit/ribose/xylose/arabinose/galactoside ABC-type transport system permease subunit
MTTESQSNAPLVVASGIYKSFGGVDVLKNASLDLYPGQIHALVGENGAGKSTLAKIIGGVHTPRAGTISISGQPVEIPSPRAAIALGVALIHQEPLTFPDLTVAENIFIGRQPRGLAGVQWASMFTQADAILQSLGVKINARDKVSGLSIADQQMVEMAAALSQNAKILLMDETTAALTPSEVRELFRVMRQLRDQGKALAFIGHRMEEIFEICDRITVLRDGDIISHLLTKQTSIPQVLKLMVGREMSSMFAREVTHTPGDVALEVRNLSRDGEFSDISFQVRRGEIVGLAGLVGAGRTEVARAIFGITSADSGQVLIDGQVVKIHGPRQAMSHGLALVPEDRQHHGVLMPQSIWRNATLSVVGRLSQLGWLRDGLARRETISYVDRLRVKLRDINQPIRELSGGNAQKVVLAKWLMTKPKVIILDEPTRGIDIGAKAEVHKLISELAAQGMAVLMISSELPEVLAMSDRVLVMREGKLMSEFAGAEATPEKVIAAATGQATRPATGQLTGQPEQQPTAGSEVIRSAWSGVERGIEKPGSAENHSAGVNRKKTGLITRLLSIRELPIVLSIAMICLVAWCCDHTFLSSKNLSTTLLWVPLFIVVACGEMMAIMTRGVDISVGSMMALSGMIAGILFRDHHVDSVWLGLTIGCLIGAALGAFNGLLIAFCRVPPIVATLGTLGVYRGLTHIVSGGNQINPHELPIALHRWSITGPLGDNTLFPWLVLIAPAVAVITFLFLRYTRTGRDIYSVGGNPDAARLRGIRVRWVTFLVYLIAGLCSGLAGLMYASRFGAINPSDIGRSYELIVISAVVVGGVSVFGGSGTVAGMVLGALLLGSIYTALTAGSVPEGWQITTYGLVILAAVIFDDLVQKRLRRV